MNSTKNNKRVFIVVNPILARKMLKLGHSITDIKPHRENPDKTVFVFNYTDTIEADFNKLLTDFKNQKQ